MTQLNAGTYQFSPLTRYEFPDRTLSLWTSQDMIVLKLITQAMESCMAPHIAESCYHIKGHGGLKKAVHNTHTALPHYHYVLRSDIKSYYASIRFDRLMPIIESYINHHVLLSLISKALRRTETSGGLFWDYEEFGIPKGSPLSPFLGALALMPLDQAMGQMKDIFYARYMDDWIVLTKTKTALRKVIKLTHQIVNSQGLQLHPTKTYIGKIRHGFNFLAYYFDDTKILPGKETIRRLHDRTLALYEQSLTKSPTRRSRKTVEKRDISLYQVDESAPCDTFFKDFLISLLARAAVNPGIVKRLRLYIGRWTRWLKLGLQALNDLDKSIQKHIPSLSACWGPGSASVMSALA